MRINKIESNTNFTALRLSPPAIQHIDFQNDNVKRVFKQADKDLKDTKYWDLEFKNNQFTIIGKNKFDGIEFGEDFDLFMYHDDAILSARGRQYYDKDEPENYRVIFDFKIGETTQEKINKLNAMSRLDKAIELTKFMEKQSKSKKDLDIIFLD